MTEREQEQDRAPERGARFIWTADDVTDVNPPINENNEDGEDDGVCADGYTEHDTREIYSGPDGIQWECQRCGAEGWEEAGT